MVAVATVTDQHGITHHYCEHHTPKTPQSTGHDHHEHADHDKHAGHSPSMFRDRFWISLLLTIPIMALSDFFQQTFHYTINFDGLNYLLALLGSIVFFYGGAVFIKSAQSELKAGRPGMMTLISLAILTAYGYSLAVSFNLLAGMDFFWELTSLITIMLLGHWIEMNAVSGASNALGELAKLLPDTAERLDGKHPVTVQVNELKVGDQILLRPGAKVPADGEVVDGTSALNESMVTGESKPVDKKPGSAVLAGTINTNGSLTVKITKTGGDTALAGIMRLVAEAQQSKSHTQILADQAAFYLTIIAIVVGTVTLIGWLFAGAGTAFAIERLVTVLVITCPHALGLAVPLVSSISTSLSARHGILVRERAALETARGITMVVFDKTGTLTTGNQSVIDIIPISGTKDDLLARAAAVEYSSEHSLGRAIVAAATQAKIKLPAATGATAIPGVGMKATIGKDEYTIGGQQLLAATKITVPKDLATQGAALAAQGKSVLYVLLQKKVVGLITIADAIRPESAEAVKTLHNMGIKTAMITGDAKAVADYVAKELGIDTVLAEVLPKDKVAQVKQLQKKHVVAMVGDGINDAPALIQADLGIAIGAGTDVAIESAGIILIKSNPAAIASIVRLSRSTYRKMVQNLIWATGYNVLAIPLAAGALISYGITLQPAVAAVVMSLSTIIVAANAQLLRRVSL